MFFGHRAVDLEPHDLSALPPLFNNDTLVVGSIRISYSDVTILILALAVAIGLRLFLYRTVGVPMRASVDDRTLTSSTDQARLPTPATPGSSAPCWPRWPGSSSPPPSPCRPLR